MFSRSSLPTNEISAATAAAAAAMFRKNRVFSTIGCSSSTSDHYNLMVRESRSLDPFPADYLESSRKLDPGQLLNWKVEPRKPSFRSLENCDKCIASRQNSKSSLASEKLLNNNYPNGNVILLAPQQLNGDTEHDSKLHDDSAAETKLLLGENRLVPELSMAVKRWRSLDQVGAPGNDNGSESGCMAVDKKSSARNSIRSWLANLFNGNGLRSSDASLRRGVIPGYDNIQSERESIV